MSTKMTVLAEWIH